MPLDDIFRRALAHHRRGELDHAERLYAGILRERPDHADALHLLGIIRMAAGAPDDGRRLIERAIALAPTTTLYRTNLAELLLRRGQTADAEAVARAAVDAAPGDDAALRELAAVLREQRRYEDACDLLKRALAINPSAPATLVDIGATLNYLGLNELSEKYTRLALRNAPDNPGLWNNLGLALKGQRRLEDAIQAFRRAAETPVRRFGLAQVLLLAGRYREAWPLFDARLDFLAYGEREQGALWSGEPLDGRTLLVVAEQGLGDSIMMARFFPHLRGLDGRIIVRAPQSVAGLLRAASDSPDVVVNGEPVALSVWVPMMSLPGRLGVDDWSRVPPPASFAIVPVRPPASRLRVGVNWRGNPNFRYNDCRSMQADALRPLIAARPDIEWLSFYKGPDDAAQAATLGLPSALAHVSGFDETAALMAGLDLIITVDTAVANLAGSLGGAAIVMLDRDCEWRWLAEGSRTPWYPSAHLLRQDREGDWSAVLDRAIAAVEAVLPRSAR